MNWLFWGCLIITGLCMFVGHKRGFVKIVVSLLTTIVTIVLVFFASPLVCDAIIAFTPLDESIQTYFTRVMVTEVTGGKYILEGEDGEEPIMLEIPFQDQLGIIQDAELPGFLEDLLIENNNEEIYKQLNVDSFAEYVGGYLTWWIIQIIAFLCTFLVAFLLVRAIVYSLDAVANLPVLYGINRSAGAALGIAFAILIIWVIQVVIIALYQTSFGGTGIAMIEESQILNYLFEHNIIINTLIR